MFLSTAAGRDVRAAGRVTVDVDAVSEERRTANVLAETGRGSRVAMAGAHLDSVTDGPGINDDGSGVAALLAAAGTLRGRAPDGARLRLGFWGAEELGLYGSRRYVAGLGEAARKAIAGYVNLDMVGTRDGDVAVYRGDDGIRRSLRRALTERGVDDIGARTSALARTTRRSRGPGSRSGGSSPAWTAATTAHATTPATWTPDRAADAAAATAATLLDLTSP